MVLISDAERRRAPRILIDLKVDYASEENYLFAYITDISATGIFVRTTTPEQPGTHLNLRFADAIEVEGEVIWVNPYRPGAPDNLHPGMGGCGGPVGPPASRGLTVRVRTWQAPPRRWGKLNTLAG